MTDNPLLQLGVLLGAVALVCLFDIAVSMATNGPAAGVLVMAECVVLPIVFVLRELARPARPRPVQVAGSDIALPDDLIVASEPPDATEFEVLVDEALAGLPERFKGLMSNIQVVVEQTPTVHTLHSVHVGPGSLLLGLYQGVPLTERTVDYAQVLPDRITIYQRPIEQICRTAEQIRRQVRVTVVHEVGHHFGLSDAELHELGW